VLFWHLAIRLLDPLIEMDPIESWVDRDELRRLADSLLAQPASSQPADATYDDDFIGFAGDSPEPLAPPIAAPLRSPGSPTSRVGVEQNARSALANARAIVQRGGLLGGSAPSSPKLHQVARTLAQASLTANLQAGAAAVGNLHVKIAPETVLEVMPVMTRYGPLILGIIVAQPLSGENVETVARGLQQVIDGGPQAQLP
jgi:hypothetical protein